MRGSNIVTLGMWENVPHGWVLNIDDTTGLGALMDDDADSPKEGVVTCWLRRGVAAADDDDDDDAPCVECDLRREFVAPRDA